MEPWIWFTLGAATAQTLRFMLQRQLKMTALTTAGATFARFLFAAPFAAAFAALYLASAGGALPRLAPGFWPMAAAGGLAQVLATACVVALFARRNFAVGITLKKTEVMLTALVGWLVLGDALGPAALAAIAAGLFGVVLLSPAPAARGAPAVRRGWRALATPAAGLGLLSGLMFAVSAVGYRGATLAVLTPDPLARAGLTLAAVSLGQAAGMAAWLAWRQPGEIGAVLRAWPMGAAAGLASMLGSLCWFAAFTLQAAAIVFAVGQVELILALAASALVFRETVSRRELAGIAVLGGSILALVAAV